MSIHSTAWIEPGAQIAENVEIGLFSAIHGDVRLAAGVKVGNHCVLHGPLEIREGTRLHDHVVIGGPPQSLTHQEEGGRIVIGKNCQIREFVTVNQGTEAGGGATRIGNNCALFAYSHVAHDCHLADGARLTNAATLAGHVHMGEGAIVSGLVGVHQFTRIGAGCFVGAGAMVRHDVPPFTLARGDRAMVHGLNEVGLLRAGVGAQSVERLRKLYKELYGASSQGSTTSEEPLSDVVLQFWKTDSKNGICLARKESFYK
jgi:UDP-N-acetylglucosamine acyltransferase